MDNGSSDGSMQGVNKKSIPLQLIFNNNNKGFAAACNTGAAHCSSKYLLFLNPDARFQEGVLDGLITFLESNESKAFGICGPRLITDTGEISRTCARFPTLKTMVATSTGLDRLSLRGIKSFHMWDWDHSNSRAVDHVIGAFFLVRTLLFQKLNGFDERFFVYLEDLDFSLRARRIGYRSYYHAGVIAFHEGGGCSKQVKALRLFYSWRSRLLFVFKHMGCLNGFIILLCTIFLEPLIRFLKGLIIRHYQESREAITAGLMLIQDLPKVLSVALKTNKHNKNFCKSSQIKR